MKNLKLGILVVLALFALVSVASAVPATITLEHRTFPNIPFSFIKAVTANGDEDVPIGTYNGWCIGFTVVGLGSGMTYHAIDSRADLSGTPAYIQSTQWNMVNWILNHPNADWRITQAALWKVDGGSGVAYPDDAAYSGYVAGYDHAAFDAYMAQVITHGSFVPSHPGEKYAVILWKTYGGQPLIIPAIIPDIPSPEFPTVAIPVGMLVSVAGVVLYLKNREE